MRSNSLDDVRVAHELELDRPASHGFLDTVREGHMRMGERFHRLAFESGGAFS